MCESQTQVRSLVGSSADDDVADSGEIGLLPCYFLGSRVRPQVSDPEFAVLGQRRNRVLVECPPFSILDVDLRLADQSFVDAVGEHRQLAVGSIEDDKI